MSRTATANTLTTSAVTKRIESWSEQMERLMTAQSDLDAKVQAFSRTQAASAEELANALAPIAESMASLIETSRQTLERVVSQSRQGHKEALAAVQVATKSTTDAASSLSSAMLKVTHQIAQLEAAAKAAREDRPPSPWGPAILAATLPLAAVLWLAWKMGALQL